LPEDKRVNPSRELLAVYPRNALLCGADYEWLRRLMLVNSDDFRKLRNFFTLKVILA
jgi:hypothetical protein